MSRDFGKRRERPDEDIALLDQIQDANAAAADRYLEYLVLQRRSTVCSLPCYSFSDLSSTLFFSQRTCICDWHSHAWPEFCPTFETTPYPNFGEQKVHINLNFSIHTSRSEHITTYSIIICLKSQ